MLLTPSNSPELNPIETLFGYTKNKLKEILFEDVNSVALKVMTTMFEMERTNIEACFKRTFKNILTFYLNLDRDEIFKIINR